MKQLVPRSQPVSTNAHWEGRDLNVHWPPVYKDVLLLVKSSPQSLLLDDTSELIKVNIGNNKSTQKVV